MTAKTDFAERLRATAATLEPLTKGAPNPYALAWWAKLLALASMIEAQDAGLSTAQIGYLRSELFGGMDSLNDLYFAEIDERLNQARADLFSSFRALQS